MVPRTRCNAFVVILSVGCVMGIVCSSYSQGDLEAFQTALKEDGFLVQEGVIEPIDLIDLCLKGLTTSCNFNNPTSPYFSYRIPPAPEQTVANMNPWAFRLRSDEAVVFVGKTSPEVKYFSYRSYVHNRFFETENARRRIWAELGDLINLRSIHTAGTPNGNDGNPFHQNVIIITTANQSVDKRIRDAAVCAGFSDAIINTDKIPACLARLGLQENADEFVFHHRTALYADEQSKEDYIHEEKGAVWRLTPKEIAPDDPFPMPVIRIRGTGKTEYDLTGALEDLRQAILEKHRGLHATEYISYPWFAHGFEALQRGVDSWGFCRDAAYLRTDEFQLPDDPNEFLVVYGINHVQTGKATYTNFCVNGTHYQIALGDIHDDMFLGSAREYLPNHPLADSMYAWRVSRQNVDGDPFSYEIPTGPLPKIELDEPLFIGFRAYLEKSTQVGPSYSELLFDRVIRFSESNPNNNQVENFSLHE